MRSMIRDDSAISYGGYAAGAILVASSLIMIIIRAPVVNQVTEVVNDIIDYEYLSVETVDAIGWAIEIITAVPIFVLIAIFLWLLVRGLEERREYYE